MAIPHCDKIKEALVSYLSQEDERKRNVTPEKAYEALAHVFNLTEADLHLRRPSGEEVWPNEVRYARWELVTEGLILPPDKSGRGVWKLNGGTLSHSTASEFQKIYSDLKDEGVFNPSSISDARDIILRAIVQRRGQREFRTTLLSAYDGKCAVSSENCMAVLEAAHIVPYKGEETNHVQNGLLLRADIHTLFDLHLIAIEPTSYRIEIAPELHATGYTVYKNRLLPLPEKVDLFPSSEALKDHREKCKF